MTGIYSPIPAGGTTAVLTPNDDIFPITTPNDNIFPVAAGTANLGTPPVTVPPSTTQVAVQQVGDIPTAPENLNDSAGRRVRLRPKPGAADTILGTSGIMNPLNYSTGTKGIVFPYQPAITYNQDVVYETMAMVHANQDILTYSHTPALKLQVEGSFTVQNQTEGRYALACIHFLRTVSKMWFGSSGDNNGTPPPVLLFDAYGQYMFNALPVVLTTFSVDFPKDVDYVPIASDYTNTPNSYQNLPNSTSNTLSNINANYLTTSQSNSTSSNLGYDWLPAHFSITVNLTVQNTPQRLRAFNLDQFRSGQLLTQGTWI